MNHPRTIDDARSAAAIAGLARCLIGGIVVGVASATLLGLAVLLLAG
jgi:hypothetical protein